MSGVRRWDEVVWTGRKVAVLGIMGPVFRVRRWYRREKPHVAIVYCGQCDGVFEGERERYHITIRCVILLLSKSQRHTQLKKWKRVIVGPLRVMAGRRFTVLNF